MLKLMCVWRKDWEIKGEKQGRKTIHRVCVRRGGGRDWEIMGEKQGEKCVVTVEREKKGEIPLACV